MQELIQKIEKWADEKGITEHGTIEGQIKKTVEELTELAIAIRQYYKEGIIDGIGDAFVTVVVGNKLDECLDVKDIFSENIYEVEVITDIDTIITEISRVINALLHEQDYSEDIITRIICLLLQVCEFCGFDCEVCVEVAYNEIKDRKGKMINGTFVKEKNKEEVDQEENKEMVNHPDHYNLPGRDECIDEMIQVFGTDKTLEFCMLNAYKYMYRHQQKNGLEDIKKADWYIKKYMELCKNE